MLLMQGKHFLEMVLAEMLDPRPVEMVGIEKEFVVIADQGKIVETGLILL